MSTPEENLETALDESLDAEAREQAIDDLQVANECEKLASLVLKEGLDTQFRERAIATLADPQCKTTLERLVDDGDVPDDLEDRARELLGETPDHTGAGP